MAFQVIKTLRPGQPGTQRWLAQHGRQLVCVRYRRDPTGLHSCTTIEIVVRRHTMRGQAFDRRMFHIWIGAEEHDLRDMVRTHGGRRQTRRGIWALDGRTIRQLRLAERVIEPAPPHARPAR